MSKKNLELVWSEEFDNKEINRDVWNYEIGYIRNAELQFYSDNPENTYIEDGCLVIETIKTGDPDRPYTSASLNTAGKVNFKYGRLEMRAKLPFSRGVWPAFWMLGEDIRENPWPKCGEIDILELIGGTNTTFATCPFNDHMGDNVVQANIHYEGERPGHVTARALELIDGDFKDDFHIFGMQWDENCIKFFVDGYCYNKCDISEIEAFKKPHFLLVNTALGGGWAGNPDETTVFPQKYYIDYIRYYK